MCMIKCLWPKEITSGCAHSQLFNWARLKSKQVMGGHFSTCWIYPSLFFFSMLNKNIQPKNYRNYSTTFQSLWVIFHWLSLIFGVYTRASPIVSVDFFRLSSDYFWCLHTTECQTGMWICAQAVTRRRFTTLALHICICICICIYIEYEYLRGQ